MQPERLQELAGTIDVDDLIQRCMGSIDFAARIVDVLVDQCNADVIELNGAFQSGDIEQVGKVAHRLKGSFANGAAISLSERADHIGRMAKEQRLEEAGALIFSLQGEWEGFSQRVTRLGVPTMGSNTVCGLFDEKPSVSSR